MGIITYAVYLNEANLERSIHEEDGLLAVDMLSVPIVTDLKFIFSDILIISEMENFSLFIPLVDDNYRDALAKIFHSYSNHKGVFDQIRLLDDTGMEVVRVNFDSGDPQVVPEDQLQFKGDRYYFRDTFSLSRGEIYVSPLDLNVEGGEIEQPLKPMICIGMPVYDIDGQKSGVIIINYLAENLIEHFEAIGYHIEGDIMLLNSEGFWLKSPRAEDEWGFMYEDRADITFGNAFPDIWQQISNLDTGQIRTEDGLFSFGTIYPISESIKSSTGSSKPFAPSEASLEFNEYYWKIVTRVSPNKLTEVSINLLNNLLMLDGFLLVVSFVFLWILVYTKKNREIIENKLVRSKRLAFLGQLAGSVSHEIRNPLGVISNSIYFLNMNLKDADKKVKDHLNIMQIQINRSVQIIGDLLTFLKTTPISLNECDLNKLVAGKLAELEVPSNISVKKQFDSNLQTVNLAQQKILEMCSNIISNAIHAMPQGGILEVKTVLKDSFVELIFKDTGEGISKENLENIYEPLFSTKVVGTGFGLAITKKYVDEHKGRINVESEEGKGTTLTIELPIQ